MLLPVRVLIVAVSWIFQPKIAVIKMVVMYVKCVDEVKDDLLHLRYIQIAYNLMGIFSMKGYSFRHGKNRRVLFL